MECMYCKGTMVWSSAPLNVDREGYHLHWEAVPAWVCGQCGQAYFELRELDHVQKALKALDQENAEMTANQAARA